jgi:hypothetical protein
MYMPVTIAAYPEFEEQVRELVDQHRKLKNEPLHLAVYFAPVRRDKRDVFVFEVIEGFGGGEVDPDGALFEFGYGSTPGFPLPAEVNLRMVLTNPTEFQNAIDNDWKGVQELRAARKAGHAIVIHADAVGKRLWTLLK